MKYIDKCPNCDHEITVEEDPTLPYGYVLLNAKGDAIGHCPKCHKELKIVDGEMTAVKK